MKQELALFIYHDGTLAVRPIIELPELQRRTLIGPGIPFGMVVNADVVIKLTVTDDKIEAHFAKNRYGPVE